MDIQMELTHMELIHADAFDVIACAGVDLDHIAFPDETRDLELSPCFGLGRLGNACRSITFDARFCFENLQCNVRRRGQGDWIPIEENHRDWHTFFKILPVVIDLLSSQFVLFKGIVIHEHESTGLVVEELCFEFFDVSGFQFIATLESTIQDGVADEVFEFAFVKGVSFPRFHEIHFREEIRFAVDLNFQAFAQVAGFVGCHDSFSFSSLVFLFPETRLVTQLLLRKDCPFYGLPSNLSCPRNR